MDFADRKKAPAFFFVTGTVVRSFPVGHALRALASETGLMAGPRRGLKPALVCHWYLIGDEGRLECRWQAEANDAAPIDDLAQVVCIENLIRVDGVAEGPDVEP